MTDDELARHLRGIARAVPHPAVEGSCPMEGHAPSCPVERSRADDRPRPGKARVLIVSGRLRRGWPVATVSRLEHEGAWGAVALARDQLPALPLTPATRVSSGGGSSRR